MHRGSCLCGAVSFVVSGPLPEGAACHCSKCRKSSGAHEMGIDVDKSAVTIIGAANLSWYSSPAKVRRGFCATCGSPMFLDPTEADWIGLHLGSFDGPTGMRIAMHIFVADRGDYYEICDGAPQFERVPGQA